MDEEKVILYNRKAQIVNSENIESQIATAVNKIKPQYESMKSMRHNTQYEFDSFYSARVDWQSKQTRIVCHETGPSNKQVKV